jgi:peptide/nickel transport system substrate-binding protein
VKEHSMKERGGPPARRRRRALVGAGTASVVVAMVFALIGTGVGSLASAAPRAHVAAHHAATHHAAAHASSAPPCPYCGKVQPKAGGSLTVLEWTGYEGSWPGLDPETDTNGGADISYLDAIFGELFELGPTGTTIDDLATGYKYTNHTKTIDVFVRKGVKFSDGESFTPTAVAADWQADLTTSCSCKPTFTQKTAPIIKVIPTGVSITLQYVDASFINAMQGSIFNWIVAPGALSKEGAKQYAIDPVGAGPFEVVSDTPSSVLALKKNPNYWQKGLPYLDKLTFKSVANTEAAYEAMLAGTGQAFEDISSPTLAKAFRAHFTLTSEPSTSPYDIQLNTSIKPFTNITARKAIYYATTAKVLDEKLFGGQTPVGESFEAPAGKFYEQKVPGYIGYTLNKAKAIVKKLGGLSFTLFTIQNVQAENMDEALQTMYQDAGMTVTLKEYTLSALIAEFLGGKWQIALQTAGAYTPATGVGVAFRFSSHSPFSGVHSTQLDTLLEEASGTTTTSVRNKYYQQAAALIAKEAWGPFLFPINGYDAVIHGAGGPGLSTPLAAVDVVPAILWEYAYNNNS